MVHGMNGGQVMFFYRSSMSGQWVAKCLYCGTVSPSWDDEDLDDDGQLVCHCEAVDNG